MADLFFVFCCLLCSVIPLPFTVDQYRVGHDFTIVQSTLAEMGTDPGATVVELVRLSQCVCVCSFAPMAHFRSLGFGAGGNFGVCASKVG